MKYLFLIIILVGILYSCNKQSGPYSLTGTIYMDCEEQQPLQYVVVDLYASNGYKPQLLATDTIGADGKFNFIYEESKKGLAGIEAFYINSGPLGYRVKNLDPADLDKSKDLGSVYFEEKGTLKVYYKTSDPRTLNDTLFVGITSYISSPDTIIGPFNSILSKEYIIHKNLIGGEDLHGQPVKGTISWYWKKSEGSVGKEFFTVQGCGAMNEHTVEF